MKIQCFDCKWLNEFGFGCKAFPEEIPFEITNGEVEHNEVREDQVGKYVYVKKEDEDNEPKNEKDSK